MNGSKMIKPSSQFPPNVADLATSEVRVKALHRILNKSKDFSIREIVEELHAGGEIVTPSIIQRILRALEIRKVLFGSYTRHPSGKGTSPKIYCKRKK